MTTPKICCIRPVYGLSRLDFVGVTKWLNTDKPLTMESLKGKVVLIDFWTYTCINCIRTLPHVTSWYEKYKDKGFIVIGVHTPEFEFEKNTENVQMAIKQYGIHYPVPQDNDYKTWNAFSNQYWPAEYLIDAHGNIRRTHFGEGEYDEMEKAIQGLLAEKGDKESQRIDTLPDQTPQGNLTPETYVGSARMERFLSREQVAENKEQNYTISQSLALDSWAFAGIWNVQSEFAVTGKNAALEMQFNADKVYLVIHPGGTTDSVKVMLDGKVVDETNAGIDVRNGIITIDQPRLYNLIDLHGKSGEHRLRLEFQSPGTQVYAFTFG